MAETTRFTIGVDAHCVDGVCGAVSRVVIDPVAQALTHLVVEPKHRVGMARLVPLDMVGGSTEELQISCTLAEFDALESAEATQFVPGPEGVLGYEGGQMYSWPYYGTGVGIGLGIGNVDLPVTYDKVPLGEVFVRRNEQVHATDGDLGKVQGLVIDRGDHHVTHVLLQEGHLLGRKEVAIPITAVIGVEDGIRLNLSKQDVMDLPPVDLEHHSE